MESIADADYCILVANLHCLVFITSIWYTSWSNYHIIGVVLNKCMVGENPAEILFRKGKILGRIPFDNIGILNSNAEIAVRESENIECFFLAETVKGGIMKQLLIISGKGGTGNHIASAIKLSNASICRL